VDSRVAGYPDKDTRFVSFVLNFLKFSLVWRGVVAVWLMFVVDRIRSESSWTRGSAPEVLLKCNEQTGVRCLSLFFLAR